MPDAASVVGQGQLVALVMAAAGVALLVLALSFQTQHRRERARSRVRSDLAGLLLITAGLALLLVRRLDPTALSRVLAMTAAMFAAAAPEQQMRRPTRFVRLDHLDGRHLPAGRSHRPSLSPSEELS